MHLSSCITNRRLRGLGITLCCLVLSGINPPIFAQDPKPVKVHLIVTVTGVRNDKGHIAASLFHGEKGFPDEDSRAVGRQISPIKDHKATILFEDITPGDYGVALLHDENKNNKMDSNRFGFPREGYGISNNSRPTRRGPKFSDARFVIPPSAKEQTIEVKMIYLRLGDVLR
jgi:uncharacterized protein (DUF2141 family)